MPQANFADGTKVCSSAYCAMAGQPQPLENFTKDESRADGFKSQCNPCRNKTKRGWLKSPEWQQAVKEQKEEKKAAERTAVAIRQVNRAVSQHGTITEELASELVQAGGGVRAMANDFWGTMRSASETTKIRGFQAVFALCKDASTIQAANQRDLGSVSDEELKAMIEEAKKQWLIEEGHIIEGEQTENESD